MQLHTLTDREKQIYRILLTNPLGLEDISKELNIALPTLKTHCLHIYDKLCVKNRIELLTEYINNNCKVL
jgi:DNA-binding CsgD family transcriptional regulator|nr:MAG TPA: ATP-dependent transcriptional regulator [Caudoviricetes sp.]